MKRSPSAVPPGARFIVRVYLIGHGDPEVYQQVKHVWHDGTVLWVLHYWGDGEQFRYCCIPLDRIAWWQQMPQEFEA